MSNHQCRGRAQWLRDGNDNVPCLDFTNEREMMYECTSADFDGCVKAAPTTWLPSRKRRPSSGQDGGHDESQGKLGGTMASHWCAA